MSRPEARAPRTRDLQRLGDPTRGFLVLVALDQGRERDAGRCSQRGGVVGEQPAVERQPGGRDRLLHRLGPLDPALREDGEHHALGEASRRSSSGASPSSRESSSS